MPKALILAGLSIFVIAITASLGIVAWGALAWVGVVDWSNPALPPQSMVVGGLFGGLPVGATGWGLFWLGGWLKNH